MKKLDFGIITPSYAPDFERCRLLSWSIEEFLSPPITHYIVVPARDLRLFNQLKKANTEIITVESLLPWWIQRMPFNEKWWLSLKSVVIRGWLLQQIVKLAAPQYCEKDVFVFADSDVTFIRPFNLQQSLICDDKVRLFSVHNQYDREFFKKYPTHYPWLQIAGQLLGLPSINLPCPGYIGQLISWKRDNVLKLHEHIENISGRKWMETLSSSWHFSEYILYGLFVDQILQEKSGHYPNADRICHEYWSEETLSDQQLQKFFAETYPENKAIMLSAKADISVEQYQDLVKMNICK